MSGQTQLLVSVRCAAEARAALAGGADLIDVKEPIRGPLGAADHDVLVEVIEAVAGRVPVSAAMGEWADYAPGPLPAGLNFAKWGLAELKQNPREATRQILAIAGVKPVLVAYADYARVHAPSTRELIEIACEFRFSAFLIDTALKDGSTLLDWLLAEELGAIRERLSGVGIPLALAGSLTLETIPELAAVKPAWFAVRGAACVGGREGEISTERVRELRELIASLRIPHVAD